MAIRNFNEIVKATQGSGDSTQSLIDWLVSNGATGNDLFQLQMSFLEGQGFTTGGLVDRWMLFLLSKGYSGDFVEMWTNYWVDGAVVANPMADVEAVFAAAPTMRAAYWSLDSTADLYTDNAGTTPAGVGDVVRCWKPRFKSTTATYATDAAVNLVCADVDTGPTLREDATYGYYLQGTNPFKGLQTSGIALGNFNWVTTGYCYSILAAASTDSTATANKAMIVGSDVYRTLNYYMNLGFNWYSVGKLSLEASEGTNAVYIADAVSHTLSVPNVICAWNGLSAAAQYDAAHQYRSNIRHNAGAFQASPGIPAPGVLTLQQGNFHILEGASTLLYDPASVARVKIYGGIFYGALPASTVVADQDTIQAAINTVCGGVY